MFPSNHATRTSSKTDRWALTCPGTRTVSRVSCRLSAYVTDRSVQVRRFALTFLIGSLATLQAKEQPQLPAEFAKRVADTHTASLKLRDAALRKTIAKDMTWPYGIWGDNLWCLSALYLNEKVEIANARLFKQANDFIASKPAQRPATSPERPGNLPWTFFSATDYVRTLCLFHSMSTHYPGRLKPETEAAMKEALWLWVSGESKLKDVGPNEIFLLLGTENHDLNRRPSYYLVTALLQDDKTYRDRKLADGHTTAEHAAAYTAFYREWPRCRARSGLWVEVGSNTYQKYAWPALFNLYEFAPDPVVRHRFGLLLDLAFIEESQISVKGRRGGGRSRADSGANAFESFKNLLYADEDQPAGSSHSRVIETSGYQLPPEAILLSKWSLLKAEPFVIRNRVLGELDAAKSIDNAGQRLASDSALVNYAYRTSAYLLGSTLQNPGLAMLDPKTGSGMLKYAGISRQKRFCGLLFDDPDSHKISEIYPAVEHVGGGRSQHSFWCVQHENILLLQRIASRSQGNFGSYNTGKIGMHFEGADLEKVEEGGWIFVSNGKAFAGVKFLDGAYQWDEKRLEATPANFRGPGDTTRILLQAGDAVGCGSYARFRESVRANALQVTADKVSYRFGAQHVEMSRYNAAEPERFVLPRINGINLELRPENTYQSPYLNGKFGSDLITVTVGALTRLLDFSGQGL